MITHDGVLKFGLNPSELSDKIFTIRAATISDTIIALEKAESAHSRESLQSSLEYFLDELRADDAQKIDKLSVLARLQKIQSAETTSQVSGLRIRIFEIAEQLVCLCGIQPPNITASLLLKLPSADLSVLLQAQDDVEKKQEGLRLGSSQ